jgi:hypothetical protein
LSFGISQRIRLAAFSCSHGAFYGGAGTEQRQTVAPEAILRAALRVLFVASYTTRNWTLEETVSRRQINDLWEAIHEIPDLLCRRRSDAEKELLLYLDEYDRKWPAPQLRLIYQSVLDSIRQAERDVSR